ncbi:MAG: DUF6048 family protein [Bacteroidales bacterium]|nr:DUF6048 family protein [Bacteroidales bacterium]NLM93170.1 hypothetical protein [Bacteroidales bacterium]
MKSISKYFFILILSFSLSARAQQGDTLVFRPSFSLGYDLAGLARNFLEPEVMMHQVTAAYEWQPNWFAAMEAGHMDVGVARETHNYDARGLFFRAGVNYNLFQKNPAMKGDEIFLAFRYGFGWLDHEAPRIIITEPYWGSVEDVFEPAGYSAHWAEIGGGLKTKLFWNLYLGWDLRIRLMLARNAGSEMEPYYISGFGKNEGNTSVMLHYSLYYKFSAGKNRIHIR